MPFHLITLRNGIPKGRDTPEIRSLFDLKWWKRRSKRKRLGRFELSASCSGLDVFRAVIQNVQSLLIRCCILPYDLAPISQELFSYLMRKPQTISQSFQDTEVIFSGGF